MICTLLRKPLAGSGGGILKALPCAALNIDACRIPSTSHVVSRVSVRKSTLPGDPRTGRALGMFRPGAVFVPTNHPGGRYPTNVLMTVSLGDNTKFFKTV